MQAIGFTLELHLPFAITSVSYYLRPKAPVILQTFQIV